MKKYSSEPKKALKKASNLESSLKRTREKVARKAYDDDDTNSKLEVDTTQEKLHKSLQDLAEH